MIGTCSFLNKKKIMTSSLFSKEKLEENNKYRFEFYNLLKDLNESNLEEISQKCKTIIEIAPKKRIPVILNLIFLKGTLYGTNLQLISKLIILIFGTEKNPNFGLSRRLLLKYGIDACKFSRTSNIILGNLINMDAFSLTENSNKIIKFFQYLCKSYGSFINCLNATSLFIQCKEKLKNECEDVYNFAVSSISILFSYFPTEQASSCLSEFNSFINGDKNVSKMFTILKNDLVDDLKNIKDLQKDQIYLPSIFDESPLNLCPSLLTAAAYFNANKCLEYLLSLGFSPQQKDLMGRSFYYYAGLSGNLHAIELVEKTKEGMDDFTIGLIISQHNDIYLANPLLGPFGENCENVLHVSSIYNNFELIDYVLKRNLCDINQPDEGCDLPQHLAARIGNVESIIKLALSPNFDIKAQNLSDKDIFQLAVVNLCVDLTNLIVNEMNYCNQMSVIEMFLNIGSNLPLKAKPIKKIIFAKDWKDENLPNQLEEEDYSSDSQSFDSDDGY